MQQATRKSVLNMSHARKKTQPIAQPELPNPDRVASKLLNKQLFNVLKVAISAALLIYLLVFQVDREQMWDIVRQARWSYLAVAAALMIVGTALRAVRWQVLLQALDIEVPLHKLMHLYFVGAFFNVFLPTGLGGDAIKMAKLARSTKRGPEAIGTTLVDRATGLWVLFVLALLSLPFSHTLLPPGWTPIIAMGTLGGVIGGWLVMGTPLIPWLGGKVRLPAQEKLERFYRSIAQLGYPALAKACLVSFVFDILLITSSVLIAVSLSVDQPLGIFLLFTPLISFSLVLPISFGGLGVREQTYILLFSPLGVSNTTAVAMSLANYALTNLVVGLLGGVLYALESTKELTTNE